MDEEKNLFFLTVEAEMEKSDAGVALAEAEESDDPSAIEKATQRWVDAHDALDSAEEDLQIFLREEEEED